VPVRLVSERSGVPKDALIDLAETGRRGEQNERTARLTRNFFRGVGYAFLCVAKPDFRHMQQDGLRLRVLGSAGHFHAFLRIAPILF
jgi:hypothetical protein